MHVAVRVAVRVTVRVAIRVAMRDAVCVVPAMTGVASVKGVAGSANRVLRCALQCMWQCVAVHVAVRTERAMARVARVKGVACNMR